MKLTLSQRVLRPIINFLVERYFPNGAFFGHTYLDVFGEMDSAKGVAGYSAAMYLLRLAGSSDADSVVFTMHEVTDNGRPVGSWSIEAKRLDDQK